LIIKMTRLSIIILGLLCTSNLIAQQWEALPLVSQKILSNGYSGGEGCQWPQAIEADKTDGSFLLFGTDVGGIYRSINGGEKWEPCNLGYNPRGNCGFAIDPNNNKRAMAVGANSIMNRSHGLYITEDQGASWKHVLQVDNYDGYRGYKDKIEFVKSSYDDESGASMIAYWSCPSGGIYKTEDGGHSWQKKNEAFGNCILKVHPDSGFIFVADNAGIYKSTDGGITFQKKLSAAIRDLDVVKHDSTVVYAVTGYLLYKSTDGGETFTHRSITGFTANMVTLAVNPLNPNKMIVCNNEGEYNKPIYSTIDGGYSWQKALFDHTNAFMPFNGRTHKFAWHPADENKVWAFGGDWITSSSDGGKRFVWDANGYTGVLVGGFFNFNLFNPNLVYLASQDYNGAFTNDRGTTWKYCNASGLGWGGFTYGAYAANENVLVTQVSQGWHQPGVLTVSRNGGTSFLKTSLVCTGLDVGCGDAKDPNVIYFSNYYSSDLGITWKPMKGCIGVLIANSFGDKEVYGTDGNSVVKSNTKGDTWEHVVSLPQVVKDVAIDHLQNKLFIVTAGNRLFQFKNGQLTEITSRIPVDQYNNRSISTVAADQNNPKIVYTAGPMNIYKTDATVKRSVDGGITWEIISPSLRQNEKPLTNDGANEVFAIRVNPITRDLWAAGGCYGVWKYVPENKMTIRITSPADGLNYMLPDSILIQTDISPINNSINRVDFFNGEKKIGENSISPFEFVWKNPEAGEHKIYAVAIDNSGQMAYSNEKNILIAASELPVVSIVTPLNGSEFEFNTSVEIQVQAHDPDGKIERLVLYAGSERLSEVNDSLLIYVWENIKSGNYVLSARAYDNSNQAVTSEHVNIKIKPEDGIILYFEDFNDGEAQDWIPVVGQWSVVQDQYYNSSASGIEKSIYHGSTFYDYTYSARIKSVWDNNFGAVFNYFNESNFYLLELDANPQIAYLKLISNGAETTLSLAQYTGGGAGVYVNIEIRNDGRYTSVLINDSIVFDKILTDRFAYGKIGLYSWWNPIWIDDIHVAAKNTIATNIPFVTINDIPFKIFPNPIQDQIINIHSGNEFLDKEVIVRIYDLKGNILYADTKIGGNFTVKPEKYLNPGIYLFKLLNQNQIFVEKIVLQ
jgi:photosystem II stability/assembly factor-like uncharacterized protein